MSKEYRIELYNPVCEFMLGSDQIIRTVMLCLDCQCTWYKLIEGKTLHDCPKCKEHYEEWRMKHPCFTWFMELDEESEDDVRSVLNAVADIFGRRMRLELKEKKK